MAKRGRSAAQADAPAARPWGWRSAAAPRGFAYIGVIEVLEENGIHPDIVTGTSAGSLVAAMYASGHTGKELETIAISMDESALTDWSLPSAAA